MKQSRAICYEEKESTALFILDVNFCLPVHIERRCCAKVVELDCTYTTTRMEEWWTSRR